MWRDCFWYSGPGNTSSCSSCCIMYSRCFSNHRRFSVPQHCVCVCLCVLVLSFGALSQISLCCISFVWLHPQCPKLWKAPQGAGSACCCHSWLLFTTLNRPDADGETPLFSHLLAGTCVFVYFAHLWTHAHNKSGRMNQPPLLPLNLKHLLEIYSKHHHYQQVLQTSSQNTSLVRPRENNTFQM